MGVDGIRGVSPRAAAKDGGHHSCRVPPARGRARRRRRSRHRGSCQAPRPYGSALGRPSARCVASSVKSTLHASARRPRGELRKRCLSANGRRLARAAQGAPPRDSEPLSIVDYLYLGQIPPLLFAADAWQDFASPFRRCAGREAAASVCHRPDRACPQRNRSRPRG